MIRPVIFFLTVIAYVLFVTFCNGYDLNSDGYEDIVLSNGYYNTNSYIYWGDESGFFYTFWGDAPEDESNAYRCLLPTKSAHGNAIADLNSDGYLDIVFANKYDISTVSQSTSSYIYWGSDSGYSTTNRSGLETHGAYGVTVGDINEDGNIDIVFSNCCTGNNKVFDYTINSYIYWGANDGVYSSTNRSELPTNGANANAVADFNQDGYFDVLFCNANSDYSYLYWGNESGTFSASNRTNIYSKKRGGSTVADLNNDSYPDIIIGERIYFSNPQGVYSQSDAIVLEGSNKIRESAVADLDDDGYLDIVISYYKENTTFSTGYERDSYIYWGSETYSYSNSNRTPLSTNGAHGVALCDFDRNGWIDIVFANNRINPATDPHTYYLTDSYVYYNIDGAFSENNKCLIPSIGATGVSASDIWSYGQFYDPAGNVPEPSSILLLISSIFSIFINKRIN